jgi:hypothetical protein
VPQRLALGPRRDTPGYTVMLRSGDLRVSVPAGGRSAVVVGAPRKTNVLVVSGSSSIRASDERVTVANTDGEVSMGVGSDPLRALRAGMLREIDGGAGTQRALAESPASLEGTRLAFAFGTDAGVGALSWPASAGTNGYRVEFRDEKGRLVASRETRATTLEAGAVHLSPGKYSARVVGLDPSGLEGAHPVERPVRVVGVKLPERAFVDPDGAVHFPTGRSLALSRADGVEVTYGSGNYFVPAPQSLELMRAEPRLVRFRLAGDASESRLWLVPHVVRARVEFGPAVPTWPHDSLEIRVHVDDPKSASDPYETEVHPKVLLGVDPVAVDFVREGNVLRGVLPPQAGSGPWVVRVEVQDQIGTELGRDFIEVARR